MNGPLINFDQAVDIVRLVSANNRRRVHGRREEYRMRVPAAILCLTTVVCGCALTYGKREPKTRLADSFSPHGAETQ
jgi:hypothetical protein